MFKFLIFSVFCLFGLCAMGVNFISQRRKKTLTLRSFLKMARNQDPRKWVVEDIEDLGLYEINGLFREYSTQINGFCLRIGKYPRIKKENSNETTSYSYRMFVSTKRGFGRTFNNDKRIAKTYKRINQERRRMEKIIKKFQKLGARIKISDILAQATA